MRTDPLHRSSLVALLCGAAWLAGCRADANDASQLRPAAARTLTFFVNADPQINIPKWGTAGTEATIDAMNALPGVPLPPDCAPAGATVDEPLGVVVAGDLVDTLDNPDNWARYCAFYDPRGEARLRFPAYEGVGNHDVSTRQARGEFSVVQRAVMARHRQRAGDFHYDEHGYHHSWDWGPLHLVQLNLYPGAEPRPVYDRAAPWNDPQASLAFLVDDLRERVGDSGRPVVLVWHYGLRGWGLEKWWTPADLDALKAAIAPYNVVLILHGHEHAYAHYEWEGVPVFMCPSPQFDRDPARPDTESKPKGFLVVRLVDDQLEVLHRTVDGWRERWTRRIELGRASQAVLPRRP